MGFAVSSGETDFEVAGNVTASGADNAQEERCG
jgi:hypothetical protein